MSNQSDVFLRSEGDAQFHRRNSSVMASADEDPVVRALDFLDLRFGSVLELGCANGYRLAHLRTRLGCESFGLDPSREAIEEGSQRFPDLDLLFTQFRLLF